MAMLTLSEFAQLVKNMRAAQNAYFRLRTPAALATSKQREREVDDAVALVEGAFKPTQSALFPSKK